MRQDGLSGHLQPLDWFEHAILSETQADAWSRLERVFADLGADTSGAVYNMPMRFGAFPEGDEMMGHFISPDWHGFYMENMHLIPQDVMARHLFTSRLPRYVDVARPDSIAVFRPRGEEVDFIRLVIDFGMRQSLGMSFTDRASGRISMVMINTVAGGAGDLSALSAGHIAEFRLAARFFFEGLLARNMARDGAEARLTPRERDCLHWAAVGLTTKEIADHLDLADDTVNGYFATAAAKLGAANRTQATVRALLLGLISP